MRVRKCALGLLALSTLLQPLLAAPSPFPDGGVFARRPSNMIAPSGGIAFQDVVWCSLVTAELDG